MEPLTIPAFPPISDRRSADPDITNRTARPINEQARQVSAAGRRYAAVFGETWVAADPDIVQVVGGNVYLRAVLALGELDQVVSVEIAGDTYTPGNPEGDPLFQGDWSVAATWDPPHQLPYAAQVGEIYRFLGKYYRVKTAFTVTSITGENTPTGTAYNASFGRVYANTNVNAYRGTPGQGVDPLMVQLIGSSYTDTLTGDWYGTNFAHAYVTARIPVGEFTTGWPTLRALVRGWRCWDPRIQASVFTRNPVLQLATLIESPLVGYGRPVDWSSVAEAADRCDDLFPDGPRIECNLEISGRPVPTRNWVETLRGYAGVTLDFQNGVYVFVPDAPRPIDWRSHFGDSTSDVEMVDLPEIDLIGATERKNIVRVKHTDTSTTPWRERTEELTTAAVEAGDEVPSVQEYRMPGILKLEQAARFATERLREHQLEQWVATVPVADEGANVAVGHVLELDSPNGLRRETARVLGKSKPQVGLWLLRCRHYTPDAYVEPA